MAMNVTRGPTTSSFSSEANFVLSNLVTDMHYDIDLARAHQRSPGRAGSLVA